MNGNRWVSRWRKPSIMLVTAAMPTGLIMTAALSAAPAMAGETAAGKTVGVAVAKAANPYGKRCKGEKVVRCAEVQWYSYCGSHSCWPVVKAHAWTTDAKGGTNYDVAVSKIYLFRWNGSKWVVVESNSEYDGWKDTSDGGYTSSVNLKGRYQVLAQHSWRTHGGTAVTKVNHISYEVVVN
jgi:hypothetical protein